MKKFLFITMMIIFLSACNQANEIETFTHVHGLEYDLQGESFFLATHHGLIQVDQSGWQQVGEAQVQHDLMGFTILNNGTMISSGHPSMRSKLDNPIGVIVSEDQGKSWKPIALHGEVDFHVLHVNKSDQEIMYGIDSYHSVLYKSENGGYDWNTVEIIEAPAMTGEVYSMHSHPENHEQLLAGFPTGLYASEDGGRTWSEVDLSFTATAFAARDESSDKLFSYLHGSMQGLHYSDDFGGTWTSLNLQLGDDIVTNISQHPQDERKLIVGTLQQNVYQTENLGNTWTLLAEEGKPIANLQ